MVIMATMKQATYHILAQLKGPTLRFRYDMSYISNSRLDILQLIRRNSDKFRRETVKYRYQQIQRMKFQGKVGPHIYSIGHRGHILCFLYFFISLFLI